MKRLTTLLLACCAGPALAGGAHTHGQAQLDVAVEAGRITLELDTPLDNLLGHERAPRTDAERAAAAAAIAKLRAAGELFRIDGAAGCTLDKVELVSAALGLAGGGPAGPGTSTAPTPPAARDGHADLEGRFEFACKAGARAGFVEVGLFAAFPGLKRIELQVATPKGQMKATLQRPASRVQLVR